MPEPTLVQAVILLIVKVEKVKGLYDIPYQIQITGVTKSSCLVTFDVGGVKKSVVVNVQ